MLLANSFSLGILEFPEGITATQLWVRQIDRIEAASLLQEKGIHSVVGHADTAWLLSLELDLAVDHNRETVKVSPGGRCPQGPQTRGDLPKQPWV